MHIEGLPLKRDPCHSCLVCVYVSFIMCRTATDVLRRKLVSLQAQCLGLRAALLVRSQLAKPHAWNHCLGSPLLGQFMYMKMFTSVCCAVTMLEAVQRCFGRSDVRRS